MEQRQNPDRSIREGDALSSLFYELFLRIGAKTVFRVSELGMDDDSSSGGDDYSIYLKAFYAVDRVLMTHEEMSELWIDSFLESSIELDPVGVSQISGVIIVGLSANPGGDQRGMSYRICRTPDPDGWGVELKKCKWRSFEYFFEIKRSE